MKSKVWVILTILIFAAITLSACFPSTDKQSDVAQPSPTVEEVPTWIIRPPQPTATPTETKPAPGTPTQTATPTNTAPPTLTDTPIFTSTPGLVTFTLKGGNLNVRRGPSVYYNYVGVLHDGDAAKVVGRDRISRWLLIEFPSNPEKTGWVTTQTQYSIVDGDVGSLPFVVVESAVPAYIRNCTNHTILIMPDSVQLLSRADVPYNEDNFYVGMHEVTDLDAPGTVKLEPISLLEGWAVDILVDGTGTKSKCE